MNAIRNKECFLRNTLSYNFHIIVLFFCMHKRLYIMLVKHMIFTIISSYHVEFNSISISISMNIYTRIVLVKVLLNRIADEILFLILNIILHSSTSLQCIREHRRILNTTKFILIHVSGIEAYATCIEQINTNCLRFFLNKIPEILYLAWHFLRHLHTTWSPFAFVARILIIIFKNRRKRKIFLFSLVIHTPEKKKMSTSYFIGIGIAYIAYNNYILILHISIKPSTIENS